jgi:hypothetical protein
VSPNNLTLNAMEDIPVDWSNEESVRYLSAINCLHNYSLGKLLDIKMPKKDTGAGSDSSVFDDSKSKKGSSCKGFLTFSDTVEQVMLLDVESITFSQSLGELSDV